MTTSLKRIQNKKIALTDNEVAFLDRHDLNDVRKGTTLAQLLKDLKSHMK